MRCHLITARIWSSCGPSDRSTALWKGELECLLYELLQGTANGDGGGGVWRRSMGTRTHETAHQRTPTLNASGHGSEQFSSGQIHGELWETHEIGCLSV